MSYILVPLIVVLMIMVVVSLVRGIVAFLQSTKVDLERDPSAGATPAQLMQNKMMFNRIKYQAAAVVVVALLMAMSK
ncbi:HIG1 domain-containing protein [Novosphingobium sp. 9U]|uniref:HIG1 domain-containing protein n=1 Tax=Novosphingobium sp. 9U TaxID=2653158 RepID=UPI0012F370C3|nr:HIG1 domain-containing protein [Novosphingobium sp. 9U]VWX53561.1 Glutamyl-tRNA synthetase [Novosphingobium sp. 9U]